MNWIWDALREALKDAFDPEFAFTETLTVSAVHWDAVAQVLSFSGHAHVINVWFGTDDAGNPDIVVEHSDDIGGMDPQPLWKETT